MGFLHFQLIFGAKKLERIQEIDQEKADKCSRLKIQLHIIDVSQEPHLTRIIKEKHWQTVKKLINSVKTYVN